jgi:hypothetical protein
VVILDGPDLFKEPAELSPIGGSKSDDWNNALLNQCANALGIAHLPEEQRDHLCRATVSGLIGINPKDELEGMIAAQPIAASVSHLKRSIPWQTVLSHRKCSVRESRCYQ